MISLKIMSNTFERLSRCQLLKITSQMDVNKKYI